MIFFILGYDSDDEFDEQDRKSKTRWNKGRSYGAVPGSRADEDPSSLGNSKHYSNTGTTRNNTTFGGITYNRYTSKSDSNLNTNSVQSPTASDVDRSMNQHAQSQSQNALDALPSRMAHAHYTNSHYNDTQTDSHQSNLSDLEEEDYIDEAPPRQTSYMRHPTEGGRVIPGQNLLHIGGGQRSYNI